MKLLKLFAGRKNASNGCGICTAERFRQILACEQARANRNGHRFSLLAWHLDGSESDGKEISKCIEIFTNQIRVSDVAGWLNGKDVGILLPYTPPDGASKLAERLSVSLTEKNFSMPDYTVYTYPQDGSSKNDYEKEQLNLRNISPERDRQGKHSPSSSNNSAGALNKPIGAELTNKEMFYDNSNAGKIESFFINKDRVWKRAIDVFGVLIGLVFTLPIFLVVGAYIKIVSPGPVFFKQARVGYLGEKFTMWKFRTMHHGIKTGRHQSYIGELLSSNKPMHKVDNELPVIPLGRLLRNTCIDELPQLFNVLFGQMSLVGPRPPIPYEVEKYLRWHNGRFAAVPGMTGLWQVSGKNELTFNEMVRLDIRYARKISPWLDIKIMLLTPLVIISQIRRPPRTVMPSKRGVMKND